jgi:hypothetical protein
LTATAAKISQKLPQMTRPWISAVSENNVTISGPPNVLDALLVFPALATCKIIRVPVCAPYHAPHIFENTAIDAVLEQASNISLPHRKSRIPTLSSSSGRVIWDGSLQSIMRSAITDVLIYSVNWRLVTRGCVSHFKAVDATNIVVYSIATGADQSLSAAIESKLSGHSDGSSIRTERISVQTQNLDTETPPASHEKAKIAIIGMSGRFPESEDLDEYWKLLTLGLDVHKPAPDFHWDVATHVDVSGARKNTSATPYGCWLKNPGAFDAKFFNMSPREAPQVDPAQRLALATAYEAMEFAGMVPDATPSTKRDRVGIFYGVTSNDWMETNSAQNIGATPF